MRFFPPRLLAPAAFALLVSFLTGCPQEDLDAPPKQATAPILTAAPRASAPAATAPAPQQQAAPAATVAAPPTEEPARVRQVIANAEQAYQSGLVNYRQQKLDLARDDFDRAVDALLTSKLDIRNTPALSDELDKLLDSVNAMEMASLEQAGGLNRQTEISPAEEANDVTFPVDPNLRAVAEEQVKSVRSDLPLIVNEPVASFISFFSQSRAGHATLSRSLERAGRYKNMIQRVLREEGVPQDLIYQAVAESGFQARAMNGHSGAGGMWQFMPSTGALYGLTRNSYVDERFDPEQATRAYAKYMKSLYAQFGDWWLAMAAYDWGPGGVQRAVQKTGYASFWDLHRLNALPVETKNYVPIILAAAIIAKNPEKYGITGLALAPAMVTDTVVTHSAVSLKLAADITGSNVDELVALNPALTRLVTPEAEAYNLRLPAGTGELFQKRIATIPEDRRDAWRYHVVVAGETMDAIARSYHADAEQLASVNQVSGDNLEEGQGLVIPVAASSSLSAGRSAGASEYTAKKGDTVVSVSDRFGISTRQLRTWNHLRRAEVRPGQRLLVSSPSARQPARRSRHGGHVSSVASRGGPSKARGKGGHVSSSAAGHSKRGTKTAHAATSGHSSSSKKRRK